jgi:4-hydroxy-3-polyprenylbenzoate decarboxylase
MAIADRARHDQPRLDPERRSAADGDLREFLRVADEMEELVVIEEADPHLEIGALFELSLEHEFPPILLFDRIKGFPPGYRIAVNMKSSRVLGEENSLEAVREFRKHRGQQPTLIPPEEVETGPIFENVQMGPDVNVRKFPTPQWHERDGGPYIGTECLIIQKDPDSDWVNVGSYRVQIQDERTLTVFIEPGKHGRIIRDRYWARGQACPMVVCVGQAPVLGVVAGASSKEGESELAKAGGRLGRPIKVVRGKVTGLPIPADAEIAIEGFVPSVEEESRTEGPFGEWPGYYSSNPRPEPVLRIEAIYHRNDPIMTGAPPAKPTLPGVHGPVVPASAAIWDALEAAGVPGVKGVWKLKGGGSRFITVVAIEQQHPGHAKMAGLVATGCGPAAYLGRITVIVDDDVDITSPTEVLWAIATRWDPKTMTDIIDDCWTGHIDPVLSPERRDAHDIRNSRAIIYAVRPYEWRDEFPEVNQVEPNYAEQVRAKWASKLDFLRR